MKYTVISPVRGSHPDGKKTVDGKAEHYTYQEGEQVEIENDEEAQALINDGILEDPKTKSRARKMYDTRSDEERLSNVPEKVERSATTERAPDENAGKTKPRNKFTGNEIDPKDPNSSKNPADKKTDAGDEDGGDL